MKSMGTYTQIRTGNVLFFYDHSIYRTEKELSLALKKKDFSPNMIARIIQQIKTRTPFTSDEFAEILSHHGYSSQSIKRWINGVMRKKTN